MRIIAAITYVAIGKYEIIRISLASLGPDSSDIIIGDNVVHDERSAVAIISDAGPLVTAAVRHQGIIDDLKIEALNIRLAPEATYNAGAQVVINPIVSILFDIWELCFMMGSLMGVH